MNNSTVKELLIEYENKRRIAMQNLSNKVSNLYSSNKDLEEIENKLSSASISYSFSILKAKPEEKDLLLCELNVKINQLKNEKTLILKKLGINSTFFEPDFDCKKCNDTGYVKTESTHEMCSCLKQKIYNIEYNKSNIGNIEKENFATFNTKYYSDIPDKEKYNSDISPKENILIVKEIVNNFIKNFDDPNEKNLLFTGNTGLGKTFLSNCIANELLKNGKTVLYQTAPVMLDSIIDYRFNKPDSNFNIINNLLNVDLLIIDDLGTESINSMKLTELFNVINTRLLNQNNKITKTIISTNLSLKNIFGIYEERLGSRFVGHYSICRFFGDDIRFQ